MNNLIPGILTILGVIAVLYTYSSIRRGGARVYTLERETILRRATSALALSTLLFIGAVGFLIYEQSQILTAIAEPAGEETTSEADPTSQAAEASVQAVENPPAPTSDAGEEFIPALTTAEPEPTLDPNIPTPTATIAVVRGFISGTSGFGVNFRQSPNSGGELIEILPEDSFVTVIEEEGIVESDGFTWIKIRTFTGDEGWIVDDFITIEGQQ